MHGIDLTTRIYYTIFMNYALKGIIDAGYCGAFKKRSVEKARQLIKDLANATTKLHLKLQGAVVD